MGERWIVMFLWKDCSRLYFQKMVMLIYTLPNMLFLQWDCATPLWRAGSMSNHPEPAGLLWAPQPIAEARRNTMWFLGVDHKNVMHPGLLSENLVLSSHLHTVRKTKIATQRYHRERSHADILSESPPEIHCYLTVTLWHVNESIIISFQSPPSS